MKSSLSVFNPLVVILMTFLVSACAGVFPSETRGLSGETDIPPIEGNTSGTVMPSSTVSRIITPSAPDHTSAPDQYAFEQNRRLGRGVNLGNALEAPNEGDWGVTLDASFFQLIASAGFDSVRIPVRWNTHASLDPPYTIDPDFFDRVDWAIAQAFKNDLNVIINIHHYEELMETPDLHYDRFLALWEQIAFHYRTYPESLYFELLNEPHGALKPLIWNDYAAEAIQIIRKSNPNRTIIAGSGNWNSIEALESLMLPEEERNLIVTVHYYAPFQFTHQGAEWVPGTEKFLGTRWEGNEREKKAIDSDFDVAFRWSQKYARPIFLGEFGAYSKADLESRQRWTEYVARSAERYGFSWAYWEFCAGFGLYNRQTQRWVEPLLQALIPEQK